MRQRSEGDHVGRPGYLPVFAVNAVILFAAITGSLWPPRARSVWAPLDRHSLAPTSTRYLR